MIGLNQRFPYILHVNTAYMTILSDLLLCNFATGFIITSK